MLGTPKFNAKNKGKGGKIKKYILKEAMSTLTIGKSSTHQRVQRPPVTAGRRTNALWRESAG